MVKSRECGKSADSVGRNILRIVWSSSIEKTHHFSNSRAEKNLRKTGGFMRTGLTKREKTTAIYFDLIDDDEQGGLTFEIEKGRLSFRLTAPYSEERKQAASELAKKNGIGTL